MIREATVADVPIICQLIRALAEYEHLSHEVVLDEDRIREHLFGTRPCVEALVALAGEEIVGFALFFTSYSTFLGRPGIYLEDIFVLPDYRGNGHGKALFQKVAQIAVQRGCGRLEWAVLDWNEPAFNFYKGMGAVPLNEWTVFRLTGETLKEASGGS